MPSPNTRHRKRPPARAADRSAGGKRKQRVQRQASTRAPGHGRARKTAKPKLWLHARLAAGEAVSSQVGEWREDAPGHGKDDPGIKHESGRHGAEPMSRSRGNRGAPAQQRIRDIVQVTVEKAKERDAIRNAKLSDEHVKAIVSTILDVYRLAQAEISLEAFRRLPAEPDEAPALFKEEFEERRDKYRARYKAAHGRKPIARHEVEDYTPVKFFQEVWSEYVKAGVVTSKYLERIDPELYRALVAFVRGSNEGRAGRSPITLEEIGVRSQRDLLSRIKAQP
jgi:hypothetical protein